MMMTSGIRARCLPVPRSQRMLPESEGLSTRSSRYGNIQFKRRDDFLVFEKFKLLQAEILKPYALVDA